MQVAGLEPSGPLAMAFRSDADIPQAMASTKRPWLLSTALLLQLGVTGLQFYPVTDFFSAVMMSITLLVGLQALFETGIRWLLCYGVLCVIQFASSLMLCLEVTVRRQPLLSWHHGWLLAIHSSVIIMQPLALFLGVVVAVQGWRAVEAHVFGESDSRENSALLAEGGTNHDERRSAACRLLQGVFTPFLGQSHRISPDQRLLPGRQPCV